MKVLTASKLIAAIALSGALAATFPAGYAAGKQGSDSRTASAEDTSQVIDVNTADIDKLVTLPGIGKAIAQRIIEYRKEHGPFKKVEELLNVRGIGERSLEKIRARITVGLRN